MCFLRCRSAFRRETLLRVYFTMGSPRGVYSTPFLLVVNLHLSLPYFGSSVITEVLLLSVFLGLCPCFALVNFFYCFFVLCVYTSFVSASLFLFLQAVIYLFQVVLEGD